MPTYEYECKKCSHAFEQFQRMSDAPLKRCPKCKGALRRLMGRGAGLIFKGSGFYQTDYRSESYKKAAKADTGAATTATTTPTAPTTATASPPPAASKSAKKAD